MDDLVDAAVVAGEPVIDRREVADDAPLDTGFLGDLAQGGLLRGLGTLEVALGQTPFDAARAVASGDERRIGNSVTYVDDDAARAGFRGNRQMRAARAHGSRPTRGSGNPGSAVN
jgi:hypothetical protein